MPDGDAGSLTLSCVVAAYEMLAVPVSGRCPRCGVAVRQMQRAATHRGRRVRKMQLAGVARAHGRTTERLTELLHPEGSEFNDDALIEAMSAVLPSSVVKVTVRA